MKKVKIEVIKLNYDNELAVQYAADGFGQCPVHNLGDTYYTGFMKPDGICDEAWKAIYQYVFALSHGADGWYGDTWIKRPGTAICSCNDGLRPVIFKIERTDEDWVGQ